MTARSGAMSKLALHLDEIGLSDCLPLLVKNGFEHLMDVGELDLDDLEGYAAPAVHTRLEPRPRVLTPSPCALAGWASRRSRPPCSTPRSTAAAHRP